LTSAPSVDGSGLVYVHGGSALPPAPLHGTQVEAYRDLGTSAPFVWAYEMPDDCKLTREVISISPLGQLWIGGRCPDPDPLNLPDYPGGLPCYFVLDD